jgi:hypothetical protein
LPPADSGCSQHVGVSRNNLALLGGFATGGFYVDTVAWSRSDENLEW